MFDMNEWMNVCVPAASAPAELFHMAEFYEVPQGTSWSEIMSEVVLCTNSEICAVCNSA